MKYVAIVLLSLVAAGFQDEDRAAMQMKKIQMLVGLLDSKDPEERKLAAAELFQIGRPALMLLEEKITQKGAGEYSRLVKQILAKESRLLAGGGADRWVFDHELKKEPPQATVAPSKEAAAYLESKYREAVQLYEKHEYTRALNLASALLTLDPNAEFAEELQKLKKVCDQKILNETLLHAQVLMDRESYVLGDPVIFTFRLTNVTPYPVTLRLRDKAAILYVHLSQVLFEPVGIEYDFEAQDAVAVDQEIPIASGAYWEKRYTVDTSKLLRDPLEPVDSSTPEEAAQGYEHLFRAYTLEAWIVPEQIQVNKNTLNRKIVFEPAVAKVMPKSAGWVAENPLKAMTTAIEDKTVDGIFISSMMLKPGQTEVGVDLLMNALKTYPPKELAKKQVVVNCLRRLTGLSMGSDREWLTWWEERARTAQQEEKKGK